MRSTRSKNQKRKRGSKSRRRLRQRGGIWGSLKTVAGHGANFTRRVFAGVKSRARAALNRHEPFDQNVALPVVRTKGLTYRLVKVSSNDYMWEIKGWDSSDQKKSFLVPTGWILQMPAEGVKPYLLIPPSEWNYKYNLSTEKDPHFDEKGVKNGNVYDKTALAMAMGNVYDIFTPKPPEPIANFDEYLFKKTIVKDVRINIYALALPSRYWGSHLPVPKSMPEEEAKRIRKQAEEAANILSRKIS